MSDKVFHPLAPMCLRELINIDENLGKIGSEFWKEVWAKEKALPLKYKYAMALTLAVGANRLTQAVREMIKGYAAGLSVEELDEAFEMMVWMIGVPFFASEVVNSHLMFAYNFIKAEEKKGSSREDIVKRLKIAIHSKKGECGTSRGCGI